MTWSTFVASVASGGPCNAKDVQQEVSAKELEELLAAVPVVEGSRKVINGADFRGMTFLDPVQLLKVRFVGDANFSRAIFTSDVSLQLLDGDRCSFAGALFRHDLYVHNWTSPRLEFSEAVFEGSARFIELAVEEFAAFSLAHFKGPTAFQDIKSDFSLAFVATTFAERLSQFVAGCRHLSLLRVRLERGGLLYLHGGDVDLSSAELGAATMIAGSQKVGQFHNLDKSLSVDGRWKPRLNKVEGTDVERLVLQDVDLAQCSFRGSINLERLHLEGMCDFDSPPSGIHFGRVAPFAWFWTPRLTLFEERVWRSHSRRAQGWKPSAETPLRPNRRIVKAERDPFARTTSTRLQRRLQAEALAKTYRALRKGREDSKNEPGAGDFYYGEMEMRRAGTATAGERFALWLYWLIAGYGLRPLRALVALAVVVAVSSTLLKTYGLSPSQSYSTSLLASLAAVVNVDVLKPELFTLSGQWTRIALKVLGPTLFGVFLLSFWGRVKR